MFRFAILGHKATTSPDFSLNDMPGGAGRMDVLCRCLSSSFFLSHNIRQGIECYLILEGGDPHKTLRFSSDTIRSLNPDERSAGALIKKGLGTSAELEFKKAADGIAVRAGGLAELIAEFPFAILDENGEDIKTAAALPENYVLSDHLDFTEEEDALLADLPRYSVGPRILHADHTITIILNELDRRQVL
ncbi:MAG: tRNA (pseudouridine(54)-N(1))-methyltransferase TrmY [Methanocalculaceae archaeon]|jgi:tRNA (pseudouridine54-N1)-methyltransferase|nr:tRNA (pseudouridine(54)-N(1))-methyltransferase TrmY [Methanocalculaceae archaeon]